ncbi:hypothetical protein DXT99_05970 [Pontibacter diazotrophicus]|uniref:Uncharacterized protein n=1 Tax=Pontibacter diazotrophicus TaxID=1400979 RepID=A0A3D8LG58_9BACT|nr:hypothetical protein [Pontibacter diazotrophicus]RDV16214.1 hypothetical protein DXT99_05970 [Pontibacter diazotrophicus]
MKISLRYFFVLLLATAVLTSCEKCGEVTLNQPTAADAEWLVYRQNDSIMFETNTGEPVVYTRSGIFAQEFPGEGFTATDECIGSFNVQIRTLMEDVAGVEPALSTRILRQPDNLQVELSVADHGIWEINNEAPPTFESHEINGRAYNNVYEVITNSTDDGGVRRILYNKEFGFLSIEFNDGRVLQQRPS